MRPTNLFLSILTACLSTMLLASAGMLPTSPGYDDPCQQTARALRRAALADARDDLWEGIAGCLNLTEPGEAFECYQENLEDFLEHLGEASERYEARRDFCGLYGPGAYDPEIDPDNFVEGVSNPYFPLNVGEQRLYQKVTDEGTETVEETVLEETREIDGVECVCVQVCERFEGELVEDTLDYYAQDIHGNVWYFGEQVLNYDDETGIIDTDGTWFAGVDGAKPGIIMEADPLPGDVYRQEVLWSEAEDVASVTALGQMVSVPGGNFDECLETLDWTPLEPGIFEAKFYAPGVGLVLEVGLDDGERTELVGIF